MFNADANDPRVPNEQKEIMHPKGSHQQQPPFLTLQIANMPQKPKPAAPPPLQYLPSTTIYPTYPQVPTQIAPLGGYNAPMNIVNQLVIGDQNPYQDHQHIHMIYEDVLPLKHLPNSLNTLSERLALLNFIKSIILLGKDGELIPFRDGPNNLFDRLKATELNPYHNTDDVLKSNPYLTLPKNMLLYRSCYPIKRDESSINNVTCSPNSIGMNLRLYRLTQGEMEINRSVGDKFNDSEAWREIIYYEYVRENIIRHKQSPNFVTMIGYALCKDSEIDFNKIEQLKTGAPPLDIQQIITNSVTGVIEKNPKAYNNDILTAITESPTYSLIQWASKTYANIGKSKRMINVGFHPDNVWFSIVFQIMAAMYTLQKHKIHITNFNIRDNVYIKDLSGMSNITSYWKYIIDDICYYVPNYGYLVMIDSKFKDLPESGITVGGRAGTKMHKIIGTIFDDPIAPTITEIETLNNNSFIDVINMNNFGTEFVRSGGVSPMELTQKVISDINKYALFLNSKDSVAKSNIIGMCIYKYMRRLMNNRIGTILSKAEQENINKLGKQFNRGDMIVYEESAGVFKFVLFMETADSVAHVLTKSDTSDEKISVKIPIGNLHEFSKITPIKQNYKANEAKLDETDLLETYNLDA